MSTPFPADELNPFNETFITAHGLLRGLMEGNPVAKTIYCAHKTQFDPLFYMMGYLVQIDGLAEGGLVVRSARPLTLEAITINKGLERWMRTQKEEKEEKDEGLPSNTSILSSAIGSLREGGTTTLPSRVERARAKARQKLEEKKKNEEGKEEAPAI